MTQIIAFSHIPKTGGLTLERILRQNFGARHITVIHKNVGAGAIYTANDLRRDLRIYPWVRSLSGHPLKIHSNLQSLGIEFLWYTFFRDPYKRYLSLYQHQFTRGKAKHKLSFGEWMQTFGRRNQMVRWIAGEEDLEAAKQVIAEKMVFVGMTENYDVSLLLLKRALGLSEMSIAYKRPVNQAPTVDVRERILSEFDRYREDIHEKNNLDVLLYEHAKNSVWPRQVRTFGRPTDAEDSKIEVRKPIRAAHKLRRWQNRAYRNLVYKPVLRLI